jgi:hypothetical protein
MVKIITLSNPPAGVISKSSVIMKQEELGSFTIDISLLYPGAYFKLNTQLYKVISLMEDYDEEETILYVTQERDHIGPGFVDEEFEFLNYTLMAMQQAQGSIIPGPNNMPHLNRGR